MSDLNSAELDVTRRYFLGQGAGIGIGAMALGLLNSLTARASGSVARRVSSGAAAGTVHRADRSRV